MFYLVSHNRSDRHQLNSHYYFQNELGSSVYGSKAEKCILKAVQLTFHRVKLLAIILRFFVIREKNHRLTAINW